MFEDVLTVDKVISEIIPDHAPNFESVMLLPLNSAINLMKSLKNAIDSKLLRRC